MKTDFSDILNPGEEVVMIVRRHPMGIIAILCSIAVGIVLVAVGFYAVGRYPDQISSVGSPSVALAALSLLLLLVILIGFAAYRTYTLSYLLVTNQSLIQFLQNGLLSGTTSQMALDHVQDAKAVQNGVFATTFNYGDLTVETSGEEENFVFRFAPDPRKVADTVLDLHRAALKG